MHVGLKDLFNWVASHNHRCQLRADHIDLWIVNTDKKGNETEDHYEILNIEQALHVLGYKGAN